jgi:hypothetical protein
MVSRRKARPLEAPPQPPCEAARPPQPHPAPLPHPEPHEPPPPDFTPVPVRARRDGWTEARQRGFIATLHRLGSVAAAARVVGMSVRSAYTLRERPGAESFAEAWDMAHEMGFDEVRAEAIRQVYEGETVARLRRGKVVGFVHRTNVRLMAAVLSGRGVRISDQREARARRRADAEEERLADLRRREAIAEAERRAAEREERDRRGTCDGGYPGPAPAPTSPPAPRAQPRVRFL